MKIIGSATDFNSAEKYGLAEWFEAGQRPALEKPQPSRGRFRGSTGTHRPGTVPLLAPGRELLPPLLGLATQPFVGCLIIRSRIRLMSGPCSLGIPDPSEAE